MLVTGWADLTPSNLDLFSYGSGPAGGNLEEHVCGDSVLVGHLVTLLVCDEHFLLKRILKFRDRPMHFSLLLRSRTH